MGAHQAEAGGRVCGLISGAAAPRVEARGWPRCGPTGSKSLMATRPTGDQTVRRGRSPHLTHPPAVLPRLLTLVPFRLSHWLFPPLPEKATGGPPTRLAHSLRCVILIGRGGSRPLSPPPGGRLGHTIKDEGETCKYQSFPFGLPCPSSHTCISSAFESE